MEAHHKFLEFSQMSVKVYGKQVLRKTFYPTLNSRRRMQLHWKKARLQCDRIFLKPAYCLMVWWV
jgi:hypothetical protein